MTEDKDKEIQKLQAYRDAVHEMASHRYNNIDDYIMIAKQAVQDYEQGNKHGYAGKKRLAQSRYNPNVWVLPSEEYFERAKVEVVDGGVIIEQEFSIIHLSIGQAKQLTYFLNDRIVRVVNFDDDFKDVHD